MKNELLHNGSTYYKIASSKGCLHCDFGCSLQVCAAPLSTKERMNCYINKTIFKKMKKHEEHITLTVVDENRRSPIVQLIDLAVKVKEKDAMFPTVFMFYWQSFEIHIACKYGTANEFDISFDMVSCWDTYYKTIKNPPVGLHTFITKFIRDENQ